MELRLNAPVIALEPGQVLTLDDAAGTRIRARSGTVWVTEENDREDHIVRAGDARTVARGGRTVIQALESSWVALCR
jgi:quercetin dioxygenase-like cupin family protein